MRLEATQHTNRLGTSEGIFWWIGSSCKGKITCHLPLEIPKIVSIIVGKRNAICHSSAMMMTHVLGLSCLFPNHCKFGKWNKSNCAKYRTHINYSPQFKTDLSGLFSSNFSFCCFKLVLINSILIEKTVNCISVLDFSVQSLIKCLFP